MRQKTKTWQQQVSNLTETGLKMNRLSEIKALQENLSLKIESNGETIWLSTKYWTWYPFHSLGADTGDLFLGVADYHSGDIEEVLKAMRLLEKIIYFVQNYNADLKDLIAE